MNQATNKGNGGQGCARRRGAWVLALGVMIGLAGCGHAPAKQTSSSSSQAKSEKVQRVIAGTRTVAQYAAALDLPLVGIDTQDGQPARYAKTPRIGQPRKPDMEKIASLKPDLYITDSGMMGLLDQGLKQQGVRGLYLNNASYQNVTDSVMQLGKLFNKETQAQAVVKKVQSETDTALKGAGALKGKKVAVLFGAGRGFMLATNYSYLGDLLTRLGLTNVAGTLSQVPSPYVPFSLEKLVAEDPDYILTLAHGRVDQAKAAFKDELAKPQWQQTTAVKRGHVYPLDDKTYPVTGNLQVATTVQALKHLLLKGASK
ncbi:helical backbone metal receptor [Lacticaseibacillus mingshuiensis]|uniref:Helical backbone metal receptor n=1 Tax=Lacticaseibacillus mingshuiensis TaxID=2799574 RepID=A0ABW4CIW1_9LACO|nr:helical backbone metal receptor [Lacticaseibacillus mingshuiensis]